MASNPPAEPKRPVRVRAIRVGHYIGRRRVGAEFDFPLAAKEELPSWLELASKPPSPPAPESTVPPMTGRLSPTQV